MKEIYIAPKLTCEELSKTDVLCDSPAKKEDNLNIRAFTLMDSVFEFFAQGDGV